MENSRVRDQKGKDSTNTDTSHLIRRNVSVERKLNLVEQVDQQSKDISNMKKELKDLSGLMKELLSVKTNV